MKVVADRDICIGAGMCVMTTDAVFDQDDEGIVVVLTEQFLNSRHCLREPLHRLPEQRF